MIYLKTDLQIQKMRDAGKIVAETLAKVEEAVRPGISTKELDRIAEDYILGCNAKPSFKGYCGFPASICASINEEVIHGIPGDRVLVEGDIISIDCGAIYKGFQGDAARTFPVGKITPDVQKLIDVTKQSFFEGIKQAIVGNKIGDISHAVQTYAESNGFSVVRDYVGHGIGKKMHEDPHVPNFGEPNRGPKLVRGMAIAVEPMINMGVPDVLDTANGWTVITADNRPSAHYENSIAILDNGPEILTII